MTFRMPAETAPHERTVMCWPARDALYGELHARRAACPCRGGPDDRSVRTGDDDRPAGAGRGRRLRVRPIRRRRRAGDRRLVVPRHRPDLRRRRRRPAHRPRLGVQRLGRQVRPVGLGHHDRPALGGARRARRALGAGRDGGRVHRRRRGGHARDDRAVPDAPQSQPVDVPCGHRGRAERRAGRVAGRVAAARPGARRRHRRSRRQRRRLRQTRCARDAGVRRSRRGGPPAVRRQHPLRSRRRRCAR